VGAHSLLLLHLLGIKVTRLLAARLLEREPTNMQALSLDTLIDKAVKHGTPFSLFPSCLLKSGLNPTQRDTLAWPLLVVLRLSARS
jgi:hypothetical protein